MENREIEDGNKLIAEFMEYPIYKTEITMLHTERKVMRKMQYHTSWDWLMPVVEKIEAIHHVYEGNYINVRISQGYVEIEGTNDKIFKNTSIEGSKIKAVWLAVVEFIKWYNQTPTP